MNLENEKTNYRLFYALALPAAVKERLVSIRAPLTGARWQREDQLHLTVVFLGSVDESQLAAIREAGRELPAEPFDLTIRGLGCFGLPERPKYLWAGIEPSDQLSELHGLLSQRLALCGFRQEERQYRPHITLARFRQPAGSIQGLLEAYRGFYAGSFQVDRVSLFQSTQGPDGSVYTLL